MPNDTYNSEAHKNQIASLPEDKQETFKTYGARNVPQWLKDHFLTGLKNIHEAK